MIKRYGSGGAGGGTVSLPVRVVAVDPLPSSYRDIEWDPPAGKTIAAYRVYVTEPNGARTLYGTYAANVESVRVGDLSPEKTGILFEVEGDYTATATGSATGSTGPQLAPTVPVARQTWNAGWRLVNYQPLGFIPEGQRRVGRTRLRNLTGGPAQALAFDVVQGTNAPATYDIAYGPWSSSLDSSSWTTLAVTIPAAPDGAFVPGVKRVVVALPAPVANGDDFVVSIRPPDGNVVVVNGFNGGGAGCWPTLQFAVDTAISNADIAVDGVWPGGTGNVFFTLASVEFLSLTSGPCAQIPHFGDSVGEGEPPIQDANWFTREGWYIKGNQAEVANGRRFWWSSNANGTYTLDQYLARLSHLITTEWINGIDVVSIQCWTHNQAPANVAAAIAQLAQIEVVADAVRAAGRGVIYTLLAPPSNPHQSADEIAAWQYIKTYIATKPHVYLDDLVSNGAGTAYAAGVSGDGIHINIAAQEIQAAALPARTASALADLGYAV